MSKADFYTFTVQGKTFEVKRQLSEVVSEKTHQVMQAHGFSGPTLASRGLEKYDSRVQDLMKENGEFEKYQHIVAVVLLVGVALLAAGIFGCTTLPLAADFLLALSILGILFGIGTCGGGLIGCSEFSKMRSEIEAKREELMLLKPKAQLYVEDEVRWFQNNGAELESVLEEALAQEEEVLQDRKLSEANVSKREDLRAALERIRYLNGWVKRVFGERGEPGEYSA